jgi:hypothetical protein
LREAAPALRIHLTANEVCVGAVVREDIGDDEPIGRHKAHD